MVTNFDHKLTLMRALSLIPYPLSLLSHGVQKGARGVGGAKGRIAEVRGAFKFQLYRCYQRAGAGSFRVAVRRFRLGRGRFGVARRIR